MKIIINIIISTIISFIDFIEYEIAKLKYGRNYISGTVEIIGKDIEISGDKNNNKLVSILRCKRDYVYTIILSNGQKLKCHIDHPILCKLSIDEETNSYSNNELVLSLLDMIPYHRDYTIKSNISQEEKYQKIVDVKKSFFKYLMYDLNVNGDHVYECGGIYVHNCVAYDTNVNVYDKTNDKKSDIPIYEIYYNNIKKPNILDKVEYFLHKLLHKLEKKERK